eukprot:m.35214 g.35214  ORF g.35214 m.35214 type:complete len:79 (-) comp9994_c0_seq1:32-268(-)
MSLCLCLYLFVVLVTFGVIVEGRSLRVSGDTINPMTLKSGDNLEIVVDNNGVSYSLSWVCTAIVFNVTNFWNIFYCFN